MHWLSPISTHDHDFVVVYVHEHVPPSSGYPGGAQQRASRFESGCESHRSPVYVVLPFPADAVQEHDVSPSPY